jgi:RHS repeat-associated protein
VAIQDLNYSYDANNNITSITDFSTSNTAKKTDFTYDTLNRLLTASTTNATSGVNYYHSYSYDAIGNITSSTPSGAYGYTTTTTGYVNPHAAISVGTSTYTYDTNGNLASDGLWTHTWDYRNRLSQSTKTGATTTYGYDHANTRVKLVTASTTTIVPFSSYSTENGTAVKYISANGQLIATLRGTGTSTVAYYTHPDRLGSQEKSTDDTPSIVELTDYYPYGSQRQNTGSLNDRKGYIGVDLDSDTGLSQAGARYYKSNVGRFISQDPVFWEIGMTRDGRSVLSDPQAQNGYAYAGNNPITYKDPNGRFWKEIINPELREYLRAATSNRGYELSQSSPAWAWAIDHPYLTGLGVGLVGGAAYALPAATLYAADATGLILGPRVLSNLDKLDELPQTAGATQKLADLGSRLGQTPTQILSQASRFGQSFVDTRVGNLGNINILLQQTANTLTRITTNPQITRVISAGTMQTNGAANNVTNGNLVPLLNQLSGVLSTLSNYLGSLKK